MEYITRLRAVSRFCFFLVCRAKRARHENDHAREWRPETKVGCKIVRIFEHDARTVKQKVWCEAEEGERDWGETLNYLSHLTRVRFALFRAWGSHATLTLHKTDFEKKNPTVLWFKTKEGRKKRGYHQSQRERSFLNSPHVKNWLPLRVYICLLGKCLKLPGAKTKVWAGRLPSVSRLSSLVDGNLASPGLVGGEGRCTLDKMDGYLCAA